MRLPWPSIDKTKFKSFYSALEERNIEGRQQFSTAITPQNASLDPDNSPGIGVSFNVTDGLRTFDDTMTGGEAWVRDWKSETDLKLRFPLSETDPTAFSDFYIVQMDMLLDQSTGESPDTSVFSLESTEEQHRLVFNRIDSETFANGAALTLKLRPVDVDGVLTEADLIKSISFQVKLVEIYSVPEPSSLILLGTVSLAGYHYRRRKQRKLVRVASCESSLQA